MYDEYGEDILRKHGTDYTERPTNIFDFFRESHHHSRGPRKGEDFVHVMKVSLEDLFNGRQTKLACRKNVLCEVCEGLGCNKGTRSRTCAECKGSGK